MKSKCSDCNGPLNCCLGRAERIFWYSLLDLPPQWEATTRHKESEGSAYYRHFYMGLIRDDRTPKPAIRHFNPEMGICQWFHFEDHRLDFAVEWLRKLGVRKLRTGISWADWNRPNALAWFDRQMEALGGIRHDHHPLLYAPFTGQGAQLHKPAGKLGGIFLVCPRCGQALRAQ